jgi:SH3-like domain-containing protein
LKAPAPNAAARGVTAPNAPASNALAPRRAALAEKADSSTFSDRKPSALALLPVAPAGQAADAMVAKAESPAAPAASRMEAQSGAAGASGNIRARPRLPQSLIASEQNAPQVVSRSTTTENGDTVVTTVYSVNGVPVSLIDESTSRNLRQPEAKVGVANQPMAMARDTALEAHSITWSDSTGRTRTLRGAMSQAELERVRRALFGPTP